MEICLPTLFINSQSINKNMFECLMVDGGCIGMYVSVRNFCDSLNYIIIVKVDFRISVHFWFLFKQHVLQIFSRNVL